MGLTTELRSWGCDEGSAHSQWVKPPVSLVQGDPSQGRGCVSPPAAFRPGLEQKAGPSLETCLHKLWTPPTPVTPSMVSAASCKWPQMAPDPPSHSHRLPGCWRVRPCVAFSRGFSSGAGSAGTLSQSTGGIYGAPSVYWLRSQRTCLAWMP